MIELPSFSELVIGIDDEEMREQIAEKRRQKKANLIKKKFVLQNIYKSEYRSKTPKIERPLVFPECKTYYCKEKNLWFSTNLEVLNNNVEFPKEISPLLVEKSKKYKIGTFIFVAEPGKDWDLYITQHSLSVKAKRFDEELGTKKKKLFNRVKRWFNNLAKGNEKILYKKKENLESYSKLRELLGGYAPNQNFALINEHSFTEIFNEYEF